MIELHARCYYPSYGNYQSSDFPPFWFVKALKGEQLKAYADIPTLTGGTRRMDKSSRNVAFEEFGKWAAGQVAAIGIQSPILVPVPSSSHVNVTEDFTALWLCRAINEFGKTNYAIDPCLTQREAVLASSKGGSRKFTDIRDNLHCHADMDGERIILVDDVVTSGNHLKACATILRAQGSIVDHAICAGRTAWERPAQMWAVPIENVDWDANAALLDF